MIRYALRCPDDHRFESWFQSADAFDKLLSRGLVACTACGRTDVEKAIMAPRVAAKGNRAVATEAAAETPAPEAAAPAGAVDADKAKILHKMLSEMRAHVEKNATYVGGSFAREAREQHLGDAPERPIWGETSPDEAKSLLEDGVPVAPLPFMPRQKTN